uniref:Glycine N-acyltransferase-like protein n=1 Tax=Neogobius melanostomus TaxID=47308 RepID=A0A8C6SF42_9GOBI
MELTAEQEKTAEMKLQTYLPLSQVVYGTLLLKSRVHADPMKVFVDNWPDFGVLVCKPTLEQETDFFKDIEIFVKDKAALEKTIRNSKIFDWTQLMCVGTDLDNTEIFKSVASEKQSLWRPLSLCHMMILKDLSCLPDVNGSGISLGSLNESHIQVVKQTWKFGQDGAVSMIQNMVKNFPSCCVLDAEGRPVSWVLTYASCAMGMLYTLPEHRGKGYARVVVCALAKRLYTEGYPVYCFIEEENKVSFQLFKRLGFTEDPSHRYTWFDFTPIAN